MMKKITEWFARLTLRKKLIFLFVFVGSLPLLVLTLSNFYVSKEIILENASLNLETLLQKNNELVAQWMDHIEDEANMLSVDSDLISIFNDKAKLSNSDIIHRNLALKRILNKYFLGIGGVYSYHLYTDQYLMVGNLSDPTAPNAKPTMYIPYNEFPESELYLEAKAGRGKLQWVPTYKYDEMYGLSEVNSIDNKEKYLFSAVKQINCISDLDENRFQPILVVSFLPDYLDNLLKDKSLTFHNSNYYVYSVSDRNIIYDYDHVSLTDILPDELYAMSCNNYSKTVVVKNRLISYDTIPRVGWKQIVSIPVESFTHEMSIIPNVLFFTSIILTLVLCVTVYFITRNLSNSFSVVMKGIQSFGEGNLDTRIPEINDYEFGILADSFNRMGNQMQTLITENYETKLRESETQIMALNLQMNPNFLYNTLSIINWMAIDNNQEEISEALLHLSKMLQHNFRNKNTTCSVREELEWLEDYLYLMKLRFNDAFVVQIIIGEDLMATNIPRFMFQPLIENAIVHGFEDMETGGRIEVKGCFSPEGNRLFSVSDNGSGMSQDIIDSILDQSTEKVGLSNLNNRLNILYDNNCMLHIYSVKGKGTTVTIELPE